MQRVLVVAFPFFLLVSQPTDPPVLQVVDTVRPACDPEGGGVPTLLVRVVDHEGSPMQGIAIEATLASGEGERDVGESDERGELRLQVEAEGDYRVAAAFTGFFTSVADRVHMRRGCLAAVMLPMQIDVPEDYLTSAQGKRGTDD